MTRRRWIYIATLVVIAAICIGPISSWLLHNEIQRLIGVSTHMDSLSIKRSNKAWLAPKFSLGNIIYTENNNSVIENIRTPVTYRGIVTSEQNKNTVTLTVNDDYLSLTATMVDKVIQVMGCIIINA